MEKTSRSESGVHGRACVTKIQMAMGRTMVAVFVMTGIVLGAAVFAPTVKPTELLAAESAAINLLPNAGFESGTNDQPADWKTQTWDGRAEFAWVDGGRSGKALQIGSQDGADAAWNFSVQVEPYAKYKLTAWVKTQHVQKGSGLGFQFNIDEFQRQHMTETLTGDHDWTQLSTEFETGDLDTVQINALLGGWGISTGTVWIDDVSLVQTTGSELAKMNPFIKIDATQIAEPISPYVYGQFIEHLGRCIYGGIWAEMLNDRKFYWPVRREGEAVEDSSPWETVGDATVEMVTENAFVGEHSPKITMNGSGGGMIQENLGVIKGRNVVGYIWVKSDNLDKITVSMAWNNDSRQVEGDTQDVEIPVTQEYAKIPFTFTPTQTSQNAVFVIGSKVKGSFTVGTVSLMPEDNIDGMRADTLRELKKLDAPVYRWPGGNFVSGYDWKDGIGERDRRPPRKNPAWSGVELNDVGIDEFLTFCHYLGTELYIAVNSGLGGVESAVKEVEYCNGSADTPMGKWRAQNGHTEPYHVKFWSIGNEMFGSWQLGVMPQSEYIVKHKVFYHAMRAVDPTIELIAVGDAGSQWSANMMKDCADEMQMISEHVYWQDRQSVLAHIRQATDSLKRIADAHRSYRQKFDSLQGKDIRICLDEWNYWYGPTPFGELGTRYFLKDGLGCAAALHEMYRNSDIYRMANYAQTVNVIGCVKTNTIHASLETTGLILVMYRHHYGTLPVATETSPRLDVQAAFTADRGKLTLSVVNPNGAGVTMPLELKGARLAGTGKSYQLAGSNPMEYNDPEDPEHFTIVEDTVENMGDSLTVPAYSATIFVLDLVP